jgi:hypothetical protein
MTVQTFSRLRRQYTETGRNASKPTKLDWSVALSIVLMVAMVLTVAFGDLGPATAYAAVPM